MTACDRGLNKECCGQRQWSERGDLTGTVPYICGAGVRHQVGVGAEKGG